MNKCTTELEKRSCKSHDCSEYLDFDQDSFDLLNISGDSDASASNDCVAWLYGLKSFISRRPSRVDLETLQIEMQSTSESFDNVPVNQVPFFPINLFISEEKYVNLHSCLPRNALNLYLPFQI